MILRKKLEDDEMSSYFWLVRFFMEFNRHTDELKQIKLERIRYCLSRLVLKFGLMKDPFESFLQD
jgi:hypothetical protein